MQTKTYTMVRCGIFAVLLAICSWISIPTIIPFTLQTFGIFLTLLVLGGKHGTITIFIYLLLGAVGIPVFSNFGAGPGILFGNTGGYLIGFLLIGLTMWASDHIFRNKPALQIFALLMGLVLCYCFGTLWFFKLSLHGENSLTLSQIFGVCVLPFMIPDLLKLTLAWIISRRLKPVISSH